MTSDFLEDVLTASRNPGPECGVRIMLARLRLENKADLAAALEAAMQHPAARATHISDRLRRDGYDLPDTTISRHRRRKCRCES